MNGLLLIDKPTGWTSFDVVAKIRGTLSAAASQKVKVGHGGTLDPLASGLLLVLVGSATKQAEQLLKLDKTYEFSLKLGFTTATGDAEGEEQPVPKAAEPTQAKLQAITRRFVGESLQTPHPYSALKIGGQRAYNLARVGRPLALEPRPIVVHSLDLINYEYPAASFVTKVSSGTYIRSLGEDIGKALNAGAYLTALRRTSIDKYQVREAIKPDASADELGQALITIANL